MVITTACSAGDKEIVRDKQDGKESDQKPEESGRNKPEEAENNQESAGKPSESDEQDYSGLAVQIDEGAVAYLEAMKVGDIETILSMTDPESII